MTATIYAVLADCVLQSALAETASPATGSTFTFTVVSTSDPVPVPDLHLWVRSAADPSVKWMEGWVTAVSGQSFTFYSVSHGGAGSISDWVAAEAQIGLSTRPYTTHSADTPPHAPFIPRLLQAAEISRAMFDRGISGRSRTEVGDIVVQNADGAMDPIRRYGFDGQEVVIRVALVDGTAGPVAAYPSAWETVLTGTMAAPTADARSIRLQLRTRQFDLDKPVQANLYAGTNPLPNGVEGTQDDLEGQPKPLAWGQPFNVTPPFVNTALLIYQVHDGAVEDVPVVYDGQVALAKDVAYADLADMYASAPAAGQYRVLSTSSGSYFRLGAEPEFAVTCDVVVSSDPADATAAAIAEAIMTRAAPALPLNASDLSALASAAPMGLDLWLDEETTAADALDMVLGSVGGWWGFDALGEFRCGVLDPPAGSAAWTFRLTNSRGDALEATAESDIVDIELAPLQDQTGGVPVKSVQVRYARNWTVQPSGLAAAAPASRRAFVAQQWRATPKLASSAIAARHALAEDWVQDTLIHLRVDATPERSRLLAMRGAFRDRLRVRARLEGAVAATATMGSVVRVVHPRWNCSTGRSFRVVGVSVDARARLITFDLWG